MTDLYSNARHSDPLERIKLLDFSDEKHFEYVQRANKSVTDKSSLMLFKQHANRDRNPRGFPEVNHSDLSINFVSAAPKKTVADWKSCCTKTKNEITLTELME